jgi:uncharacterized protein YjbJ (UPF0337 family)
MGKSTQELRGDIEHTREDLGETLDAIGERVSPGRIVQRRKARVRHAFSSARESVMGSAESAQGGARQVTQQAGDAASTVADKARQAPEQVVRQTQGNPLAMGLVAFGVGLVVASVIPASKPEQQAAGAIQDTLEPLKERAVEAAREVKDEVQGAAQAAAGEVKDTAAQAASEVRDRAQSSAEHVKDEAQSAASDTKDRAAQAARHTRES